MQTAAAALSLASLSLSTSLPTQVPSTSSTAASNASAPPPQLAAPIPIARTTVPTNNDVSQSAPLGGYGSAGLALSSDLEATQNGSNDNVGAIGNGKGMKKKGTDYKCESCSKASFLHLSHLA